MSETKIKETTELWDDYRRGLDYQSSIGLSKKLPQFVRFYQGEQWPKATKNTQNMPRPVVNIIKMICRNKKSAILSVPVRIVYQAEHRDADVERFNRFSDYILKEMGMEALDKKGIDDAVKKGSYFYHFYWDAEAVGKDGNVEGALRCETIDPLNIFFADPTECDEQKQEWILLVTRENVKSVRAKCDRDVDTALIVSDENESKYGTVEQEGDGLCTVLTRYFRQNGEVYCEKATQKVVVQKPFPLTPDIESAKAALGFEEDAPEDGLPDRSGSEPLSASGARARLYPIVVGNYEPRERCIYGLGEVEGLIPNQKAINFNLGMALLNNQENAWGKYVVAPNALKGQAINNEPGQVLTDWTGTQQGIKKLGEQSMNASTIQLIDTLTQLTRAVTGSTELMTGETVGSGMSGAAIAALQAQAQQPVEELREAFWLVKKKQGKVLAQFFRLCYAEKEFTYEAEGPEAPEGGVDIFSSADYGNVEFSVVVETTSGTKSSAAGDITVLDVLLAKGAISTKTYLQVYPESALSNRTELLKAVEAEEMGQMQQLAAQLEQLNAQAEAMAKAMEEQQKTVDSVTAVIAENQRLKSQLIALYQEATAKIEACNRQTAMGNAKIAEVMKDAGDMAQYIAGEKGMV